MQTRVREGLDRAKFDRLLKALTLLIDYYGGRAEVPKQLALAFVDIPNYFFFKEDVYPPAVLEELQVAAHELTSLANELFSPRVVGITTVSQETAVETALRDVEELLLGDNSILVQVRARQGLDRARYDRLVSAIELLVDHYRGRRETPKRLALAFVDISNNFSDEENAYPRDVLTELEDAAIKLTWLGNELFSE
jgi:hypothetical protein